MTPPQVATFNHYVALRPAAIVLPEPKAWRWNWDIKVEGEPSPREALHNAARIRRRANVAYGLFAAVLVALALEVLSAVPAHAEGQGFPALALAQPWSPFTWWFRLAWGGAVLALGHVAAVAGRRMRDEVSMAEA